MEQIRTVLVGSPTIYRDGLRFILAESRFVVAAEAASSLDAAIFSLNDPPDLCILTPGSSLDATIRTLGGLSRRFVFARLVLLYEASSFVALHQFFDAGVHGCLPTLLPASRLLNALELLMLNDTAVHSSEAGDTSFEVADRMPYDRSEPSGAPIIWQLSNREKEILEGIKNGESNKHIARRLVIAEATVKVHVRSLLRKLGVQNRTCAAVWALNGLRPAADRSVAWRGPSPPPSTIGFADRAGIDKLEERRRL